MTPRQRIAAIAIAASMLAIPAWLFAPKSAHGFVGTARAGAGAPLEKALGEAGRLEMSRSPESLLANPDAPPPPQAHPVAVAPIHVACHAGLHFESGRLCVPDVAAKTIATLHAPKAGSALSTIAAIQPALEKPIAHAGRTTHPRARHLLMHRAHPHHHAS